MDMLVVSGESLSGELPDKPLPESDAHHRRVAQLTSLLRARVPSGSSYVNGRHLEELCSAFDGAVEFGALEGKSVAEAIREFFEEEDWGPAQAELKKISGSARVTPPAALPVMPQAARRLLRTTDENTSPVELERIAEADPALTGRLVGAANSARFGSRFEIVRLRDAVMRLGVPEARKVLLAACFGRLFASGSLRELWEHSQHVADTSCEVAALCEVDGETAYVAGLLHDIGRLGFIGLPAAMRVAEQSWIEKGFPLVYAEAIVYSRDHASFGAEILAGWELPRGIVEAVAFHHRPEASQSRLDAALFLAEDLTARIAKTPPEDLWSAMRRKVAGARTGLDPERLDELFAKRQFFERARA